MGLFAICGLPTKKENKKSNCKLIATGLIFFMLFGFSCILYFPNKYFNPYLPYERYEFSLSPKDSPPQIINGIHLNYDFEKNKVNLKLTFKTRNKNLLVVHYPDSLNFTNVSIENGTVFLKQGIHYKVEPHVSYVVFEEIPINTSLEINASFKGLIYPNGNFILNCWYAKPCQSYYVGSNPLGLKQERMSFKLGPYTCVGPCVTNTLSIQKDQFNYLIFKNETGQEVKIIYSPDENISTTSVYLSAENKNKKEGRDIIIALGIALVTGCGISLVTLMKKS